MEGSIHGSSVSASPATPALRGGRLDRALARTSDAPLREGNHLSLLKNGPNTFDDWLEAISRAEHWVHLDNYIFRADGVGQRFAEALAAAASGALFAASLLGARFPRLLAWPLATLGGLYGGLGMVRAARSATKSERLSAIPSGSVMKYPQ